MDSDSPRGTASSRSALSRAVRRIAWILVVAISLSAPSAAQSPGTQGPVSAGTQIQGSGGAPGAPGIVGGGRGPSLTLNLSSGSTEPESLGSALEIVLLMTALSMAPALIMTMTCFTRIVIVLSFLKRAMSLQEMPPALVVTGFAVFLSVFVMKPVFTDMYENAYEPYAQKEIGFEEAANRAGGRMKEFMLRQTREQDVALVLELSKSQRPVSPDDVSFAVVVPSFILSEIKTAFQMGFVLFLPFVVIDLVIASILVSMGMFTLPPIVVSTPLKLLLFIMVDGWNLVIGSLADSFART